MKVAVEGCCHGELDAIYAHLRELELKRGYHADVLLICGDFQAVRNVRDLQCMAVPPKFRQLGQFEKYYTGRTVAPLLTIVIGGNHEASNYLWELYHGGWLAPNIYYLGHAGCVRVNGVRIAGASGIFKSHDYHKGHHEKLPYGNSEIRSAYHIREYNFRRLSLLSPPSIFLSHDWPKSIELYGDTASLVRRKPFFGPDIKSGKLGSPPLMGLLKTLKPDWWFSAHLHVRFEATVTHSDGPPTTASGSTSSSGGDAATAARGQNPDEIIIDDDDEELAEVEAAATVGTDQSPAVADVTVLPAAVERNPDEIMLDDEEEDVIAPPPPPPRLPQGKPNQTKFLALDKCLPRRQFMEIVDIPAPAPTPTTPTLTYDAEWLAITRAFHPLLSTTSSQPSFPSETNARQMVQNELTWVKENVGDADKLEVGERQRFVMTAPGPGEEGSAKNLQPPWYTNPQTEAFCRMLGIENKINPPPSGTMTSPSADARDSAAPDIGPGPSLGIDAEPPGVPKEP